MNPVIEIEAGDIRDCLDDGTTNPLWTMKGYTQVQIIHTEDFKTHKTCRNPQLQKATSKYKKKKIFLPI